MLTMQNFEISSQPFSQLKTDLAVVIDFVDHKCYQIDDNEADHLVNRTIEKVKDKKLKGDFFTSYGDTANIKHLLVTSTGLIKYHDGLEAIRIAASAIVSTVKRFSLEKVTILLNGPDGEQAAGAVAEGLILGSYLFNKYLKEKEDVAFQVELVVNPYEKEKVEARVKAAALIAETVNEARDMVNEPSGIMTPEAMAQAARKIARDTGLKCTVLDEKQLQKHEYNGLLSVGGGSSNPPRLIILQYTPKKTETDAHLAFVGKGVTFDTGGISIKPAKDMWYMKGDMAGAGAVLYAMKAIAQLAPSMRVTGIVAAAENCVDANAQNPGNIFVAKNGKSIHVDNTDAEGRLILTDGLFRAGEEGATHIIDVATLTGGCVVALGKEIAGAMGDDNLVQTIINAGQNVGEKYWHLPLPAEYNELLKLSFADVNNSGGRWGSPLLAGLFLQNFVPENTTWAHLDIAGTAFNQSKWKYYQTDGATGFAVRTFVDVVVNHTDFFKTAA